MFGAPCLMNNAQGVLAIGLCESDMRPEEESLKTQATLVLETEGPLFQEPSQFDQNAGPFRKALPLTNNMRICAHACVRVCVHTHPRTVFNLKKIRSPGHDEGR